MSSSTEAPPRLGYRPALEGLRGVAVILVVGFHALWLPGGFLGVDLFLVLSGFLITTLLLEEWRATGTISLRDFYIRRALRLYPALAVFLVLYAAFTVVTRYGDVATQLKSAAWSAVYLANVPLAVGHPFSAELNHLWTLAAEAQFYLLWPPILVFLLRRKISHNLLLMGIIGIAAAAWILRVVYQLAGTPWPRIYFGPEVRVDTILIGCALAFLFVRSGDALRPKSGAVVGGVAAFAVLAALVDVAWQPALAFVGFVAVAVLAALLITAATAGTPGWYNRVLSSRAMRELGRVSYGWYLWHVPWIAAARYTVGDAPIYTIAAIIASFVCAELSYHLVEQRFLRMKRRFTH